MFLGITIIKTFFFSTEGHAEYMTLEQFIYFLNEKQRDPRLNEILYPLYDEKRGKEIIETYEQDEVAKSDNRLTKDGLIRLVLLISRFSYLLVSSVGNSTTILDNVL